MDASAETQLSEDQLIKLYRQMVTIRLFEDKIYELFLKKMIAGTTHLCTGQEAISVGVCAALRSDDYVTCTYRGHGALIARGSEIKKLMAELLGKRSGVCGGKGGSMHLTDFTKNVLGSFGVVGAGLPVAVGAALSAKMRGTDQVSATFFGESATNIGTFHEAMNLAAIWRLPVLFVCENNLYGEHTPVQQTTPVERIADRGCAYGIPGLVVDGNDVLEVYERAAETVGNIRRGSGPVLIECMTYRQRGHSRDDPGTRRPKEELEYWLGRDPIVRLRGRLMSSGLVTDDSDNQIRREVQDEIERALEFAQESPHPGPEALTTDVFSRE